METEFSIQHSQDPAVRPYPEPEESISFPHTPITSVSQYYSTHSYRGADKSLARPTSRCILFDGKNISFDASLVIYIVLIFLQL